MINIFIAFLNINEVDKFLILGNRKQRVVNEVRSQNSEVIFVTGIRAMLQKYCALKGGVLDPYYFYKREKIENKAKILYLINIRNPIFR
ncbi:hypothetical protein [Dapis sp. BLCC M172]|uniref:hypothetical protein n=1 Tax=Dapis sp. BLCC M172 TaxID=2975281 RepID=UPI003CE9E452